MKIRLTLLGPPASGKGTQADLLSHRHGFPVLSTGNMLRAEIARKTAIGIKADELINAGNLVPDAMVVEMISHHLSGNKFLFDGFPRTLGQAKALDQVLEEKKMSLDVAIHLDVSEETIRHRILNRVICTNCHFVGTRGETVENTATDCPRCGTKLTRRVDDTEEVLARRLSEYHEKTAPLLPYYKETNRLSTITGTDSRDEVYQQICQIIGLQPQLTLTP